MTVADVDAAPPEVALRPSAAAEDPTAELAVPRGCPFLVAEEGGWRLDLPTRDHRCAAFVPPASLAPEKQARLCLTPSHTTCSTYLASLAAREARLGVVPAQRTTRWSLARTTSVIEDSGGFGARIAGLVLDRRRWPAIPAVLLVGTLFALALSGFRAEIPATVATSSPEPTIDVAGVTSAPAPGPTSAPARTTADPAVPPTDAPPPATPAASAGPVASEPTATFRSYRVRSGDTLSGIAGRFDTTVEAIAALNNLANSNQLAVGQVLLIP